MHDVLRLVTLQCQRLRAMSGVEKEQCLVLLGEMDKCMLTKRSRSLRTVGKKKHTQTHQLSSLLALAGNRADAASTSQNDLRCSVNMRIIRVDTAQRSAAASFHQAKTAWQNRTTEKARKEYVEALQRMLELACREADARILRAVFRHAVAALSARQGPSMLGKRLQPLD